MLIASFPAGPWQTNCYVVAPRPQAECVIIDPGYRVEAQVIEILDEQQLTPRAVLATHGHLDHVFSVAPLCRRFAVPVWIHPADRHLLTDPVAGLGPGSAELIARLTGAADPRFEEPAEVESLIDGATIELAAMTFRVQQAPGHTAGSTLLATPYVDADGRAAHDEVADVVFTGDVVFAGSIGRTDLPGGDDATMRNSLRDTVLGLDDRSALLPGHGRQSTMIHERASNPYLQSDYLG